MLFLKLSKNKFFMSVFFIVLFSFIYGLYGDENFNETHEKGFFSESLFDFYEKRLFYSANVQTTLGLGNIWPRTRIIRTWTIVQILISSYILSANF